jgi:thiol-disulfide isomerase/thioredoxin
MARETPPLLAVGWWMMWAVKLVIMGRFLFIVALLGALSSWAQTPAGTRWAELTAKREKLTSYHQEFDIVRTYAANGGQRAAQRQLILDAAGARWRERTVSGSENLVRLYDGQALFSFEEGAREYVRAKSTAPGETPLPTAYRFGEPEWTAAVELPRQPCKITGHPCVILEVPLKGKEMPGAGANAPRMLPGTMRLLADAETGLLVSYEASQEVQAPTGGYRQETRLALKQMHFGKAALASLFTVPANFREVTEFTPWNAAKLMEQFGGKPAPALQLKGIDGKAISLAPYGATGQGKIVLLDFWATWCPPCRADAPVLDKLYQQHSKDLAIVGISVSEERVIVEKFLREYPRAYPVALTTENELSRPYQAGPLPLYLVIDREGKLAAAVEGDQGIAELRRLLKKAGLDTE